MSISDIAITSLETITGFNIVTGDLMFVLDELQTATIANSEETTEITGKGGRRLSTLKRNKSVTISGENGLLSAGLLAVQTGGEFETKDTLVLWPDYVTVTGNAAKTTFTAVGTTGAEIKEIFVKNTDGSLGEKFVQGAAAAEGVFTYDPATGELAFADGAIADGTEIVVYYDRKVKGDVLVNSYDNYSGKAMLYIDAFGEDRCSNVYRIQIFVPKADFNGTFDMTFSDSQNVHSFEATSLAGYCGGNSFAWTYTVFGENAEDVA